jgi:Phosphomannomutase
MYGELTSTFGERRFRRVDIKANDAQALVNRLSQELKRAMVNMGELDRFIEIDGLKAVYRDKSWVLVRGSGTEPVIRIYSEALSDGRVNELIEPVASIINRAIAG